MLPALVAGVVLICELERNVLEEGLRNLLMKWKKYCESAMK